MYNSLVHQGLVGSKFQDVVQTVNLRKISSYIIYIMNPFCFKAKFPHKIQPAKTLCIKLSYVFFTHVRGLEILLDTDFIMQDKQVKIQFGQVETVYSSAEIQTCWCPLIHVFIKSKCLSLLCTAELHEIYILTTSSPQLDLYANWKWQHQAFTWTNTDLLTSFVYPDFQRKSEELVSMELNQNAHFKTTTSGPMIPKFWFSLQQWPLPGTSELTHCGLATS